MERFPPQRMPAGPVGVEVRRMAGSAVVALRGDHDLSTKPGLLEALASVRRSSRVVLDLTRCTFVDSTIIGAILDACRARPGAAPAAVSVVLPSDTSYVYRALSVIGVRDLIPVHASVEAAVSAANATTGSQRNPSGRPV